MPQDNKIKMLQDNLSKVAGIPVELTLANPSTMSYTISFDGENDKAQKKLKDYLGNGVVWGECVYDEPCEASFMYFNAKQPVKENQNDSRKKHNLPKKVNERNLSHIGANDDDRQGGFSDDVFGHKYVKDYTKGFGYVNDKDRTDENDIALEKLMDDMGFTTEQKAAFLVSGPGRHTAESIANNGISGINKRFLSDFLKDWDPADWTNESVDDGKMMTNTIIIEEAISVWTNFGVITESNFMECLEKVSSSLNITGEQLQIILTDAGLGITEQLTQVQYAQLRNLPEIKEYKFNKEKKMYIREARKKPQITKIGNIILTEGKQYAITDDGAFKDYIMTYEGKNDDKYNVFSAILLSADGSETKSELTYTNDELVGHIFPTKIRELDDDIIDIEYDLNLPENDEIGDEKAAAKETMDAYLHDMDKTKSIKAKYTGISDNDEGSHTFELEGSRSALRDFIVALDGVSPDDFYSMYGLAKNVQEMVIIRPKNLNESRTNENNNDSIDVEGTYGDEGTEFVFSGGMIWHDIPGYEIIERLNDASITDIENEPVAYNADNGDTGYIVHSSTGDGIVALWDQNTGDLYVSGYKSRMDESRMNKITNDFSIWAAEYVTSRSIDPAGDILYLVPTADVKEAMDALALLFASDPDLKDQFVNTDAGNQGNVTSFVFKPSFANYIPDESEDDETINEDASLWDMDEFKTAIMDASLDAGGYDFGEAGDKEAFIDWMNNNTQEIPYNVSKLISVVQDNSTWDMDNENDVDEMLDAFGKAAINEAKIEPKEIVDKTFTGNEDPADLTDGDYNWKTKSGKYIEDKPDKSWTKQDHEEAAKFHNAVGGYWEEEGENDEANDRYKMAEKHANLAKNTN